jgi:hypothetical protein
MAKNNKQKPPNTLLSSQTTHPLGRATSPRQSRVLVVRTIRNPPKWGFPLGAAALFGPGPCRSDESTSYVRENSESNGLIGRVFRLDTYRAHRGASAPNNRFNVRAEEFVPGPGQPATARALGLRQVSQRARRRQYSACRAAAPASGRAGSLLAVAPTPRCRSARC